MSKRRKKNAQQIEEKTQQGTVSRRKRLGFFLFIIILLFLVVIGGIRLAQRIPETGGTAAQKSAVAYTFDSAASVSALYSLQAEQRLIDVHEHIESLEVAPQYLAAMDEYGIGKMCLMGSSKFTLTLNEKVGFTEYDENNEELLKIVKAYPDRFEAWVTINPLDPDKLEKFRDCAARGATGLKLYIGHGYVAKTGEYMFHTAAMDDPGMLPLYAFCQEQNIPVCIHVNPYKGKKGFTEEFVAVLTQFPDMKVVCPHFMLSSIQSSRLEEFLDTFPNLYSDVSFGEYFMKDGLTRISKDVEKFRKIFVRYPDRFMFATDLVLIKGRSNQWAPNQFQAYLDMLTRDAYTTPVIPGETLNGLALPPELLERILVTNYEAFQAKRPRETVITRKIDWTRMNVRPVERQPGQMFPPEPVKNKQLQSQ